MTGIQFIFGYILWWLFTEFIWQLVFYYDYNKKNIIHQSFSEYKDKDLDNNPLPVFFRIPFFKEVMIFIFIPLISIYGFIETSSPIDSLVNFTDQLKLKRLNKKIQNMIMKGKTPSQKLIFKSEILDVRIKNMDRRKNKC